MRTTARVSVICSFAIVSTLLASCSDIQTTNNSQAQEKSTPLVWNKLEDAEALKYQNECKRMLEDATEKYLILENPNNKPKDHDLLVAINNLDIVMDKALGQASLFRNVHPNSELRSAADECQQKFYELNTTITLSPNLYNKLAKVKLNKLDSLSALFVTKMIEDLKRSGVNLDLETRNKVKKLNEEILLIGQTFNKNIREDTRQIEIKSVDELKGLPQDFIDAHAPNDEGKIVITTAYPDYLPIMKYAEDDDLRLRLYKEFRKRGYPQNESVLKEMLIKRRELASILGYDTYADYVMADLMIENPGNAANFIEKINSLAKPRSDKEYQELLERLKKADPSATKVGDWQKSYIAELLKNEKYAIDSQEIRQYFRYDDVRDGIFKLTETLFDVSIEPWKTEVWHDSVKSYKITDGDKLIGYFYLDMHPREGKYNHAAAFGIQDGVEGIQPPIKALVCNFPGGDGSPGYMEHGQVETFLHEFGHLLHGLFGGHQKWLYFSGIKTEWDFVEAPSQMLEEWVWDAETLKTFAKNEKGQAIPDSLINKMNAGREFGRGLRTRHQMFYASVSLSYYTQSPEDIDLLATLKSLQPKYSPYDYVDDTYFHTSFGHLYGYSAIYYTYMWSLVIASDMFEKFRENGLRNVEIAKLYREKVLEPGGSKPAAQLVENFLGRPYSFDAFAEQLNSTGAK